MPAEFIPFEHWQPQPDRCVLLCTKCYDNAAVLARLHPEIPLVPVQNGLDPQLEARAHRAAAVAVFVAQLKQHPPTVGLTRRGPLYIGSRTGRAGRPFARRLADLFSRSRLLPIRYVRDIRPIQISKLWYNAAIAPLAAAASTDNAALLENPVTRRLLFALLVENYQILRAAGLHLGWLGPFPPALTVRLLRWRALVERLVPLFARSLRGTYCSIVSDWLRGPTELDYYTGQMLRLARQAAVAAPLNAAVYERLHFWAALGRVPVAWAEELEQLVETNARSTVGTG
jgi:2-dehydropantoate 2-reductase